MTKRHTRLFFVSGTALFSLVFVVLTIDSHRQFGQLTHEDKLTPQVVAGKQVWHRKDCINCHTLLGEGAYFAPDLTKITQLRGEPYLRQFLKDPSRFYSEEQHGRLMPNPNLSEDDIGNVIAFLGWVSNIDNNGWPPRPILVSAATPQSIAFGTPAPAAASADPIALGQALFARSPPACFSCHSTQPGVQLVGPSLAGVGARAAELQNGPGYTGAANTPGDYIRESILHPSAYVVPGATFSAGGQSIMPAVYQDMLTPADIDHLVAYLVTLK
ncbi:MAG: cytochrome c [Vicinamibacterales bacterium]